MKANIIPPTFESNAFHCPHCNVYSHHDWSNIFFLNTYIQHLRASVCKHCSKYCLWLKGRMIYPTTSIVPNPSKDMPEDVKQDYIEAQQIAAASPRAAVALLRLALQKLMPQLGEKGSHLDSDIASLVKKGLPIKIQQALDSVRVIGNNAVHPGEINLEDNPETAYALFSLLNIIVEVMITQPRQVEDLYSSLPQGALAAIERRDNK